MHRRCSDGALRTTRRQALAVAAGLAGLVTCRCSMAVAQATPGALNACGARLFPDENVWNVPIADLPRDPNSDAYLERIGLEEGLHPDFGSGL